MVPGSAHTSKDALEADRRIEQYGLLALNGPGAAELARGEGGTWDRSGRGLSWGSRSRPTPVSCGLTTSDQPYHGPCGRATGPRRPALHARVGAGPSVRARIGTARRGRPERRRVSTLGVE